MDAYRLQPLALTDGHPSQKRARSTAEAAPWSLAQYRNLIPTITLPSATAMVALGVGLGTVIGFERRPVPERQAAYQRRDVAHRGQCGEAAAAIDPKNRKATLMTALPSSLVSSFNCWT